ncbi:MAG: peptidase U32 family protein, partial [Desulfobulbales bacterium]
MNDRQKQKPELLAPAGSVSVFEKAVAAGADAVYIGAPALNARALGKEFTLREIGAMIQYAHDKGVKLYLAANSLLKENEITQTVENLAMLEALQADALIVQDLAAATLAREICVHVPLHASTMMNVHNAETALVLKMMGFTRIITS